MTQFNVGDTVVLKSDGPKMTVLAVGVGSTDWISCRWFDGKKFHTELFPPDSIRLYDESENGVHVV